MPSLSTEMRSYQPGELSRHPWQDNVPDIQGQEWQQFLTDVGKRGIVEPIRVSVRQGFPVIVDGHQRHRAAVELGVELIEAYVQDFATEAEEVDFLAAAARMRRHLTDSQRVTLGRAYDAYFQPMAAERKKAGKADLTQKIVEGLPKRNAREAAAQAAAVVGLNRETYRQGKIIQDRAPAPVVQAWEREEISTNAAHQLTKAPDPVKRALENEDIDVYQAIGIDKDKALKQAVISGEKTVQEAASLYDMLKEDRERKDAEMGTRAALAMQSALQKIMDISLDDYAEVLNCRHNTETWQGSFSSDWQEAIRHMKAVAQAAEGRLASYSGKTINAETLN